MNRLAVPALLGLAAVLAVLVAAESLLPGPGDEAADQTGIRPVPRLPHVDTSREVAETVDHTDAWVRTILARPLFTRDRRPADAPKLAAGGASMEGPLPRLTGVAVTPVGRLAIFAGSDSAKPVVVGEGGMVAGYHVKSILPGAVRIQGPRGERTLSTSFDPNPRPPQVDVGQPQFGQPQYGQPQFGQPQYGQPGQPPFPQPGLPGQFPPGFPRVPGLQFPGRPRVGPDGAFLQPQPGGRAPGSGFELAQALLPDSAARMEVGAPPAMEPL